MHTIHKTPPPPANALRYCFGENTKIRFPKTQPWKIHFKNLPVLVPLYFHCSPRSSLYSTSCWCVLLRFSLTWMNCKECSSQPLLKIVEIFYIQPTLCWTILYYCILLLYFLTLQSVDFVCCIYNLRIPHISWKYQRAGSRHFSDEQILFCVYFSSCTNQWTIEMYLYLWVVIL